MTDRSTNISRLYDGLAFVSRQSRELGAYLHPELPLVAHSLLAFIDAEPNARAVDVAAAYGLDKSTVSRQIAHLETAGLVVRAGEKPGRRGHVLQLTDQGTKTLHRAAESSRRTLTAHLTDWPDNDIEALARLLARFSETSRRARLSDTGHQSATPNPNTSADQRKSRHGPLTGNSDKQEPERQRDYGSALKVHTGGEHQIPEDPSDEGSR